MSLLLAGSTGVFEVIVSEAANAADATASFLFGAISEVAAAADNPQANQTAVGSIEEARTAFHQSELAGTTVISEDGRRIAGAGAETGAVARGGRRASGKRYFEAVSFKDPNPLSGVVRVGFESNVSNLGPRAQFAFGDGATTILDALTASSPGPSFAVLINEVARFAADLDAGKIWFGDSTGWYGDPGAGTGTAATFVPGTPFYPFFFTTAVGGPPWDMRFNFGASAFAYTLPTGFSAWDDAQNTTLDTVDRLMTANRLLAEPASAANTQSAALDASAILSETATASDTITAAAAAVVSESANATDTQSVSSIAALSEIADAQDIIVMESLTSGEILAAGGADDDERPMAHTQDDELFHYALALITSGALECH